MASRKSKEAADLLWNCFSFIFSLTYLTWKYFDEQNGGKR